MPGCAIQWHCQHNLTHNEMQVFIVFQKQVLRSHDRLGGKTETRGNEQIHPRPKRYDIRLIFSHNLDFFRLDISQFKIPVCMTYPRQRGGGQHGYDKVTSEIGCHGRHGKGTPAFIVGHFAIPKHASLVKLVSHKGSLLPFIRGKVRVNGEFDALLPHDGQNFAHLSGRRVDSGNNSIVDPTTPSLGSCLGLGLEMIQGKNVVTRLGRLHRTPVGPHGGAGHVELFVDGQGFVVGQAFSCKS